MTNAELLSKIKAEIERLHAEHSSRYGTDEAGLVLENLEDFLSTLESEKPSGPIIEEPIDGVLYAAACGIKNATGKSETPINQDELEEEIHKYNKERFDEYFPEQDGDFISEVDFMTCLGRVARHFAEWGAEHYLKLESLAKFAEMTGSIDTMPKNTLPPSKECEKGLREPLVSDDLKEAAHSYSESDEPLYSPGHRFHWDSDSLFGKQIETTFIAGAKWDREQMMKEAVEGVLVDNVDGTQEICLHGNRYGDKVLVIVLPKDERL